MERLQGRDVERNEMTDKELLEMAAKAAEYDVKPHVNSRYSPDLLFTLKGKNWNPLTDDGDALRLAVQLNLFNTRSKGYEWPDAELFVRHDEDPYAATRRAIVRAAAEIGKAMP
jgi:hypothetical protein